MENKDIIVVMGEDCFNFLDDAFVCNSCHPNGPWCGNFRCYGCPVLERIYPA